MTAEAPIVHVGQVTDGNTGDRGRIIVREVDGPLGPIEVANWEPIPEGDDPFPSNPDERDAAPDDADHPTIGEDHA